MSDASSVYLPDVIAILVDPKTNEQLNAALAAEAAVRSELDQKYLITDPAALREIAEKRGLNIKFESFPREDEESQAYNNDRWNLKGTADSIRAVLDVVQKSARGEIIPLDMGANGDVTGASSQLKNQASEFSNNIATLERALNQAAGNQELTEDTRKTAKQSAQYLSETLTSSMCDKAVWGGIAYRNQSLMKAAETAPSAACAADAEQFPRIYNPARLRATHESAASAGALPQEEASPSTKENPPIPRSREE